MAGKNFKNRGKNAKKKFNLKNIPTLQLKNERDIAMDFATKVYERFNKIVKSVILFGSSAKHTNVSGSDIDIVILLDDASIRWDQELIAWYREELEKIVKANSYNISRQDISKGNFKGASEAWQASLGERQYLGMTIILSV